MPIRCISKFLNFYQIFEKLFAASSYFHVLVSHNGDSKKFEEHSGWTFSGQESEGIGVSRDITYANFVEHLYAILGVSRS